MRSPSGMMNTATWQGYPVSEAQLLRARQTRKFLFIRPLGQMEGVRVRIVMSRAHGTHEQVRREGDKLIYDADEGPEAAPRPKGAAGVFEMRSGRWSRPRAPC